MNYLLIDAPIVTDPGMDIFIDSVRVGRVKQFVHSDGTRVRHAIINLDALYPGAFGMPFAMAQGFGDSDADAITQALRDHWTALDVTVRAVSDLASKLNIELPDTAANRLAANTDASAPA